MIGKQFETIQIRLNLKGDNPYETYYTKIEIIDKVLLPFIHKDTVTMLSSVSPSKFTGYRKVNNHYSDKDIESASSVTGYLCKIISYRKLEVHQWYNGTHLDLITVTPSDLRKEICTEE